MGYNKHGLLLEVFEQEYRGMVGKPIPFKFFGFNCVYDLLVAWPEVVEVTQLGGGQVLLIGVPDKKTEHIAKMVGNQRDNSEGFNRRTGQMLSRVSSDVIHKIEKVSGRKTREVPEFMKKQIEQLAEMEFFEDGLFLTDFQQVYEQEFGYPLDYKSYGFYSLQDFCYNGLEGSARVNLTADGWWKLFPNERAQQHGSRVNYQVTDIPEVIKNNVKTLILQNPFGLTCSSFLRNYEHYFGPLCFRQYRCSDLFELLLLIPDCCVTETDPGGQIIVFPVGTLGKKVNSTLPLNIIVLGEVKNNIHHVLQSHPGGVSLNSFVKGYEGYFGCLPLALLRCKNSLELLKSLGDVCQVIEGDEGHLVVPLGVHTDVDSNDIKTFGNCEVHSVIKVLEVHRDGINISCFPKLFLETFGVNIPSKLRCSNLLSMFRKLDERVQIKVGEGQDIRVMLKKVLEECDRENSNLILQKRRVHTGWVNILPNSNKKIMMLQMTDKMEELKEMESMMEIFYTSQGLEQTNFHHFSKGLEVAALYSDLLWHRGVVVEKTDNAKKVVVEYVDWGWRGMVSSKAVKLLDKRFGLLPCQTVMVKCMEIEILNSSLEEAVRQGNMKGFVGEDEEGHVYMDLYTRNFRVKSEKMITGKIASKTALQRTHPSCVLEHELAMKKLVRDSLAKLREKERRDTLILT